MRANKIIGIFLVLVAAVGLFGQDIVEAIVAVVNDDIITLSEYKQEYNSRMRMLRAQLQGEELIEQQEIMKNNLLESLITDKLLLQEARKLGLNVTEQMRMTLDNIKRENNLTSDEQLKRALAQQGIAYEDFLNQMEQNMLKQNIIFNKVGSKIVIDDSEIVSYYKVHQEDFIEPIEYTLKMIYIAGEGKSSEEIESKKGEIDNRLDTNGDFGQVAGEFSEGPEKDAQGDLGSYKEGELQKELEQAVENLEVDAVTSWLNMQGGWVRLKLVGKKDRRLKEFQDVRKEIEGIIFEERQQEELDKYLRDIRSKSYIKVLIGDPSID
ncbi:MAG: SurA N-terminal domain-containing protein [Candidatus Aminicenantes bacterium]|jgi:parvulin-like peptidyl-prolyl isomerase